MRFGSCLEWCHEGRLSLWACLGLLAALRAVTIRGKVQAVSTSEPQRVVFRFGGDTHELSLGAGRVVLDWLRLDRTLVARRLVGRLIPIVDGPFGGELVLDGDEFGALRDIFRDADCGEDPELLRLQHSLALPGLADHDVLDDETLRRFARDCYRSMVATSRPGYWPSDGQRLLAVLTAAGFEVDRASLETRAQAAGGHVDNDPPPTPGGGLRAGKRVERVGDQPSRGFVVWLPDDV